MFRFPWKCVFSQFYAVMFSFVVLSFIWRLSFFLSAFSAETTDKNKYLNTSFRDSFSVKCRFFRQFHEIVICHLVKMLNDTVSLARKTNETAAATYDSFNFLQPDWQFQHFIQITDLWNWHKNVTFSITAIKTSH